MSVRSANPQACHRQYGMTLIELMVSLVIGLFLSWGAFQVYLQSKSNYRAAEVMTRLQETARFALDAIEPDLRLAGFWGRHRNPALLGPAGAIAVSCGGDDVTPWALALDRPLEARDDAYDLECAPLSGARDGSDVLVVRHAGARVVPLQAGQIQMQSNLVYARLFDDGVRPAEFSVESETRDLVVNAYYVDNESSFVAGIPSLRRLTLVNGGVIEDQEMISGVENLQVQFGLDTNGDGTVERYVDPDDPAVGGSTVLAVRLWMLVRSEDSPGLEYRDTREYQPPDADAAAIVPGDDGYPAAFQRLEVTKTILLRNQGAG